MMTAIQRKYIEIILTMSSDCLTGGISYGTYLKNIEMMLKTMKELAIIEGMGSHETSN